METRFEGEEMYSVEQITKSTVRRLDSRTGHRPDDIEAVVSEIAAGTRPNLLQYVGVLAQNTLLKNPVDPEPTIPLLPEENVVTEVIYMDPDLMAANSLMIPTMELPEGNIPEAF